METVPCNKCGHPVLLPFRIRQFELRQVIASGGMGTVYRAFDLTLERDVAIKLLKAEMAEDKHVLESFYREARVSASLNHTNIIHIYAFDEFEGNPYLVMELADSGSLDSRIEKDGSVPELQVLDIGYKISSALESALKHELLHRDIKPGNILFNAEGEPKLVDFGLARHAEDDQEYEVWGTPYYVAPEKIKREGEDFLSDMYSLGGTLYHALTGHVPFEAKTIEEVVAGHVHTPLTPPARSIHKSPNRPATPWSRQWPRTLPTGSPATLISGWPWRPPAASCSSRPSATRHIPARNTPQGPGGSSNAPLIDAPHGSTWTCPSQKTARQCPDRAHASSPPWRLCCRS